MIGSVNDRKEDLALTLYTDADFTGEKADTKSTNGGLLMLTGPHTSFPIAWVSKKQSATSRSTTESEIISLAHSMFSEALPALSLWEKLLERPVKLQCLQDNQATILVVKKGYSPKLRHVARTHKVNLGSLYEVFDNNDVSIQYIVTDKQAADIFTKALPPHKWEAALRMIGILNFNKYHTNSTCVQKV
jgi:hypothetical protein